MQTLECRGLAAGSLYKILLIGLLIPIFIFSFFCGIASYFGYATITLNGHLVYGLKGILVGCVLGVILPMVMAAFLWCLMTFGIWIWTRVSTINLTIKN